MPGSKLTYRYKMALAIACDHDQARIEAALAAVDAHKTRKKDVFKLGRNATREQIAEFLHYDPATGKITWLKKVGRLKPGDEAGSIRRTHRMICVGRTGFYAHRIAWLLYYGEWPKQVVNHKNCNGLDNRIENLEDISHADNTRHAHRMGLIRLPERKTTVKLTPQQAIEIRASKLRKDDLARKYGVNRATVEDIIQRRTWKNAEYLAAGWTVLSNGCMRSPSDADTTGTKESSNAN
jgi:hypothetical protein